MPMVSSVIVRLVGAEEDIAAGKGGMHGRLMLEEVQSKCFIAS